MPIEALLIGIIMGLLKCLAVISLTACLIMFIYVSIKIFIS